MWHHGSGRTVFSSVKAVLRSPGISLAEVIALPSLLKSIIPKVLMLLGVCMISVVWRSCMKTPGSSPFQHCISSCAVLGAAGPGIREVLSSSAGALVLKGANRSARLNGIFCLLPLGSHTAQALESSSFPPALYRAIFYSSTPCSQHPSLCSAFIRNCAA